MDDLGTAAGKVREFRDQNLTCFQCTYYFLSILLFILSFVMFCSMFEVVAVNSHLTSLSSASWQMMALPTGLQQTIRRMPSTPPATSSATARGPRNPPRIRIHRGSTTSLPPNECGRSSTGCRFDYLPMVTSIRSITDLTTTWSGRTGTYCAEVPRRTNISLAAA